MNTIRKRDGQYDSICLFLLKGIEWKFSDDSFLKIRLKLQYQIELIPHYHLKVLSYLVLL